MSWLWKLIRRGIQRPSTGSGSTEGRVIYRRWRFLGFEYRSDCIAHDYMRRWVLFTPLGMIRLHKILRNDSREFHDHPMDFVSFIIKGGYVESRPDREPRWFEPGNINVRAAEDLHYLTLIDGPAWTLVFALPFRRTWGFHTEDGWIAAGDYDEWKRRRAECAS